MKREVPLNCLDFLLQLSKSIVNLVQRTTSIERHLLQSLIYQMKSIWAGTIWVSTLSADTVCSYLAVIPLLRRFNVVLPSFFSKDASPQQAAVRASSLSCLYLVQYRCLAPIILLYVSFGKSCDLTVCKGWVKMGMLGLCHCTML